MHFKQEVFLRLVVQEVPAHQILSSGCFSGHCTKGWPGIKVGLRLESQSPNCGQGFGSEGLRVPAMGKTPYVAIAKAGGSVAGSGSKKDKKEKNALIPFHVFWATIWDCLSAVWLYCTGTHRMSKQNHQAQSPAYNKDENEV